MQINADALNTLVKREKKHTSHRVIKREIDCEQNANLVFIRGFCLNYLLLLIFFPMKKKQD